MDNKQARKTGRTIFCCGFILILLSGWELGLAMVAVGILMCMVMGRCPHCGRQLLFLSSKEDHCPSCHRPL